MFNFFSKTPATGLRKYFAMAELKILQQTPRYIPLETTLFGKKIFVNDVCTLLGDVRGILEAGVYEFDSNNTKPVIIDCGANIGISVVYFKRLYPNAKIIAFEPDPVLFSLLSKNISNFAFENIELRQAAVWVNDKGVDFRQEGGHSGRIAENKNDDTVVSVPSVCLRSLLESVDSVNMLKMDIEGAEAAVLFDCGQMLKKCEHVFIEYHSRNDQKQELHKILELFYDMGYRYHVHEAFVRKHPFVDTNCMVGMDLQLNLFFIKE